MSSYLLKPQTIAELKAMSFEQLSYTLNTSTRRKWLILKSIDHVWLVVPPDAMIQPGIVCPTGFDAHDIFKQGKCPEIYTRETVSLRNPRRVR